MVAVLAIDPGDKHVGWAEYINEIGEGPKLAAGEWHARDALHNIEPWVRTNARRGYDPGPVVVVENFVLYPQEAGSLSWQPLLTSEMIGAIKWIVAGENASVVLQGADIKKPMMRQMRARGLKYTGHPSGHARDAELHLYHYLYKEGIL